MADQSQETVPNATPSPQPPPDLPEGTIHLKIKVPHGNLPPSVSASTFSLGAVPVTSKIGDVRRQIQSTIPTNPATSRQRLLYGGRSLYDDAESVQDALNTRRNPEQKEYVIHLIVRAEAGADGRTGSPARAHTPSSAPSGVPSAAQLHQNALQQHQQLQQRLQQHNVALGQQNPFPHFMLPHGLPAGPMQAQIVNPQDPAAIQRMMQQQQQAQMHQGQPNGAGEENNTSTSSTSVPPPAPESHGQTGASQPPQGEAPARPQTQPPQSGGQHHTHHGPNNFHAEVRGPNGEVWEYHQQTFNIPHGHGSGHAIINNGPPQQGQPGMQSGQAPRPPHFGPPGWAPGMPAMPGMPQINIPHIGMPQMGMPQWPPQIPQAAGAHNRGPSLPAAAPGTSALDRARNDMAEIRRSLNELRLLTHAAVPNEDEERRTLQMISQLEQRARDLERYIDPFSLGTNQNTQNAGSTNAQPQNSTQGLGRRLPPLQQRLGPRGGFSAFNLPSMQYANSNNNQDVTAYLLSSPQGPQAIIYSPQHGAYTTATQAPTFRPTPTTTTQTTTQRQAGQNAAADAAPDPGARAAAHAAIQDFAAQRLAGAQAIAAGGNPMGAAGQQEPLQQLMGHFWLLLRILIFAYFLMGSNMGFTKMFMLAAVGLGFWVLRVGVMGNPEVVARARRWWNDVVGLPQAQPRAPGQAVQPAAQAEQAQAGEAAQAQRNRMPTPEQVAQRLLDQNVAQDQGWLRERIRPVERAVALFVASLWPGIGEAHVRAQREAREAEERRAAEAEVEARRRAEEEAQGEKKEGGADTSATAETAESGGSGAATAEGAGQAQGVE